MLVTHVAAYRIKEHVTNDDNIVLMDAAGLSKAIHSRKVSCVEVMSAVFRTR